MKACINWDSLTTITAGDAAAAISKVTKLGKANNQETHSCLQRK